MDGREKIIVAMDFSCLAEAVGVAQKLVGKVSIVKVGSVLFTAAGPAAIREMKELGFGVFLDLKFHDIPNTVAGAVQAALNHKVRMINMHASGGEEMMAKAVKTIRDQYGDSPEGRPLLLGVTVLTSQNFNSLHRYGLVKTLLEVNAGWMPSGISPEVEERSRAQQIELLVAQYAKDAQDTGLDGVITSPQEIAVIRKTCGPDFKIVAPGVRPAGADVQDQKRVGTPGQAIRDGADYIVVGRPIIAASDPVAAAEKIAAEIAAVA